jgi:hypothetical protein
MFNQLILNILSVFKATGVNQAQSSIKKLGESFKEFAGRAGLAAGAFAAFNSISNINNFAQGAIDQAQQLERNMSAVGQIFREQAPAMELYIKRVEDYGLAEAEAAKAVTFIGSVLKQSGFSLKETAQLTQVLNDRAVDLATTYGYDVQEALMGMTALFRGEYDPIEKFGVAMKQSEINSEMAARGFDKLEGAARRYAEQQIRVELLLERSADAAGAFERLQGSLFVSTKKLEAAFTNLQADAGEPLQDGLAALNDVFTELIQKYGGNVVSLFENIGNRIEGLVPAIEDLTTVGFGLITVVDGLVDALGILFNLFGAWGPTLWAAGEAFESMAVFGEIAEVAFAKLAIEFDKVAARIDIIHPRIKLFMEALKTVDLGGIDDVQQKLRDVAADLRGHVNIIDDATLAEIEYAENNKLLTQEALRQSEAAFRRTSNAARGYNESLMALVAMGATINPFATWTYTPPSFGGGGGGAKKDPIKDFFDKLKDDVKKQKAALQLESMGASQTVIETILGASDWETVYKKIASGGKKALDEVAKLIRRGYEFAQEQREKLKKLKDDVKDAVTGIADNLLGAFNLKDFGKSSNEVIMNMRKMVERIRAFKDEVTRLAKAGLNPQLLQQILQMGPVEGLSFARALLAGGQIGEMNQLYKEATGLALQAGQGIVTAQANYYITVNGGVGDKKTIGAAIVEAIKAYERTSGTNWRA